MIAGACLEAPQPLARSEPTRAGRTRHASGLPSHFRLPAQSPPDFYHAAAAWRCSQRSGHLAMQSAGGTLAARQAQKARSKAAAAAPDPTQQVWAVRPLSRCRRRRPPASPPPTATRRPHGYRPPALPQQDRHTQLGGLLLRAEVAPDPLERVLAVCRCGGGPLFVAAAPDGFAFDAGAPPCCSGPCCASPPTFCAPGAALATSPPQCSASTTCRAARSVRGHHRWAAPSCRSALQPLSPSPVPLRTPYSRQAPRRRDAAVPSRDRLARAAASHPASEILHASCQPGRGCASPCARRTAARLAACSSCRAPGRRWAAGGAGRRKG